jgi:membrane associated rhomboid family serine protease
MEIIQEPETAGPEPVRATQPVPVYTYIILGGIAAVFLTQMLFGDALKPILEASSIGDFFIGIIVGDDRSAFAAGFVKKFFVEYHQYWRILTGAAVHGGVLHVVMNSYAFFLFGRLIEMLSNRAHLAIVFLLSCIGGGLLSLLFLPDGVSVGASGGIVGMLGYMTVYAFRRRRFIAPEFRRAMVYNIGSVFIFGLILFNVVDNYGHIGGLIVGSVYALIQIPSNEYTDPRVASPVTKAFGVATLGIWIATCLLSVVLIFNFRSLPLPEIPDAPNQSSPAR